MFVDKMRRAAMTGKLKVQPLNFLRCTLPGNLTDWVKPIKNQGHNSFQISQIGISLSPIKLNKIKKNNYGAVTN